MSPAALALNKASDFRFFRIQWTHRLIVQLNKIYIYKLTADA